jgi:hypothetical protein
MGFRRPSDFLWPNDSLNQSSEPLRRQVQIALAFHFQRDLVVPDCDPRTSGPVAVSARVV